MEFTGGEDLFAVSVLASAIPSFCCHNFLTLLFGLSCEEGFMGGVEPELAGAPPLLSSFTQLGLGPTEEGLGKAGLESDGVALREGLRRDGFCAGS